MNKEFYAYVHAKPNTVDVSGIFYVGKGHGKRAWDMFSRNFHHTNILNKYGKENILVGKLDCSNEQIAFDLEVGLIKCLRRNDVKLANMTNGGEGTVGYVQTEEAKLNHSNVMRGRKASDETKEKMKLAHSGDRNHFYGRTHSEETKAKIAIKKMGSIPPNKGMAPSLETRAKISATLTGTKGRIPSDETRKKLSESRKGISNGPLSAETKQKLSESIKISWIKRRQDKISKGEV
jgi:group I intron endonuclease